MTRPLVSIVSFACNEEQNLPVLYDRLRAVLDSLDLEWEWIVVDDHSSDGTFQAIRRLAAGNPRVAGLRLSRRCGSHLARACGLHHCRGDCAITLAADLQDPPETIPALLDQWRAGAQVVSAVRTGRPSESLTTRWFSGLYHWLLRRLLDLERGAATDTGFSLLDRQVLEEFRKFREANVSLLALLQWMGFRRTSVPYEQQPRLHGRSRWTLPMKIKLTTDTIIGFSSAPIRWMGGAGLLLAGGGLVYAVRLALAAKPVAGWDAVLAAVLVVGGLQMVMLRVLGEYLWRTLAESRRRPQYLVEAAVGELRAAPPESG